MGIFADSTLQIFLSMYHGSLMSTFIYDYILRNCVHAYQQGLKWNIVSNIALGLLCVVIIIWAVLSVWSKIKRNLVISYIVLLVIFVVRLVIGIPEFRQRTWKDNKYQEDLVIFVAQMAVHLFGVIATFLLSRNL